MTEGYCRGHPDHQGPRSKLESAISSTSFTSDNLRTCPLFSTISWNFKAYHPGREFVDFPSQEITSNYPSRRFRSHLCCWSITTLFLQFRQVVHQRGSQLSHYVCRRFTRFQIRLSSFHGLLFYSCSAFRITTLKLLIRSSRILVKEFCRSPITFFSHTRYLILTA